MEHASGACLLCQRLKTFREQQKKLTLGGKVAVFRQQQVTFSTEKVDFWVQKLLWKLNELINKNKLPPKDL